MYGNGAMMDVGVIARRLPWTRLALANSLPARCAVVAGSTTAGTAVRLTAAGTAVPSVAGALASALRFWTQQASEWKLAANLCGAQVSRQVILASGILDG